MKNLIESRPTNAPRFPARVFNRRLCLATLSLGGAIANPLGAADYFWEGGDGDWDLGVYTGTVVPGTGGSLRPSNGAHYDTDGTWTAGTANWQNSARDTNYYWVNAVNADITATSGPTGPWMANPEIRGSAIFDVAGGGLVKVADVTAVRSTGIFAGSINFKVDGYELYSDAPGGARMETSFGSGVVVDSGVTAKIGSGINLWLGGSYRINGGGTLNLSGSISALSANPVRIVGGTTVNLQTGGTLGSPGNQVYVGAETSSGILNIDGGGVVVGQNGQNRYFIVGQGNSASGTSGVATLSSGSITISNSGNGGFLLGDNQTNPTTATFNMNGGVVTAPYIVGGAGSGVTSTFNFNGGTIVATAGTIPAGVTFMDRIDHAFVQLGGATFDTNGRSITVAQILAHDAALGNIRDGGLTKTGIGTLTLSGSNSYTGDTVINGGTLSIELAYLFDQSNVQLNGGSSSLNLGFSGTDTIAALYFDGIAADIGTWGSIDSDAEFKSAYLTGTGMLNVTAVPEPSSAMLLLSLAGGALFSRRRR